MSVLSFVSSGIFEKYIENFKSWVSPTLYNLTRAIMNSGSKYHFISHILNGGCGTVDELTTSLSDIDSLDSAFSDTGIMSCVSLPSLVTSEATSANKMFYECSMLHLCDLTYMPTANITSMVDAFTGCTSLTDLVLPALSCDLDLSYCPLTAESAATLIDGLSSSSTGTLTLSSTTYNSLTSDQIAVGTNKGWTISN